MKLNEIRVFDDQAPKHNFEVVYETPSGEVVTRVFQAETEEKIKKFVTALVGQVRSIKKVDSPKAKVKASVALGWDERVAALKTGSSTQAKPEKATGALARRKAEKDAKLNESVTFGVAKIKKYDGRDMFDTTDFAKLGEIECRECDGKGKYPSGRDCFSCEGSGKEKTWVYDYENLNVSGANAYTIIDMLGTKEGDGEGGVWRAKDLPEIRRKLIKLKNGDTSGWTEKPTDETGPARVTKDEDGVSRISRGVRMIGGGRSQAQIDRYVDALLDIVDFAQKNDAVVCWS